MKRRKAIRQLAIISSTIAIFPSCDFEAMPVYDNIPLTKKQWRLIGQLTKIMLPNSNPEITTPEKTKDYLLTVINDCYSPKKAETYLLGLNEFQLLLKEKYPSSLERISAEKKIELFCYLAFPDNNSEPLTYFYNTTLNLTQQHFTTSEYFMKNYLDFEFIPGRYLGCVNV